MKAAEVARDVAARLSETDSIGLNATLDWAAAMLEREAARVDAMTVPMPLHAMPIALKDIFETVDMPTGFGSPIFDGWSGGRDSAAAFALRQPSVAIWTNLLWSNFVACPFSSSRVTRGSGA